MSRYKNRVFSKSLSLCTCNYPFYSPYKSLIHRVNVGQFKLSTDIEKNPGPSCSVDATKKGVWKSRNPESGTGNGTGTGTEIETRVNWEALKPVPDTRVGIKFKMTSSVIIVLRNFQHSDRDTKGILTFGK